MNRMGVALQMYTIRDETAKDFVGALKKVAEIGYEGVEFAGYGGLSAEEMKKLLAELGLKSVGSHVGLQRMLDAADEEIAYNKTIGTSWIVVPSLPPEVRQDEAGWRDTFAKLKAIGEKCKQAGIGFGYHNHGFEFDSKIDGEPAFDALYASVPADLLKVELDACWAYNSGYDPVAYVRKYAGRLPMIHFKDIKKEGDSSTTVELGTGDVPLHDLLEACKQAGVEWLIVEQDVCQNPSFEAIAHNYAWLKQHYIEA